MTASTTFDYDAEESLSAAALDEGYDDRPSASELADQGTVQHPRNADGTYMAHCNQCGVYVDDTAEEPPVDFLCDDCQEPRCVTCGVRPWGHGYCGEECSVCAAKGNDAEPVQRRSGDPF